MIDEVREERCKFDDVSVQFDENRTFDWWVAHVLMDLEDNYPAVAAGARMLGNGRIYDGGLTLDNQNGTSCSIRFEHAV